MVEKLVKSQTKQKRLVEKTDVLEDQVFQLTEELKKKNRVVQYYILREESGTLASAGNDTVLFNKIYSSINSQNVHQKPSNKSALLKVDSQGNRTSILSSFFHPTVGNGARNGGHQQGSLSSDPINLHFYKELNTRLQSVLEDTILKNMKLQVSRVGIRQ